ncbi:uncharacterized protein si:ch211-67f13.7 [Xyrichtys novacula]|uniref:Uncharacterized protein si:ch211-67f13.7 n=1 Tax=Xyrichtys novacula TaxID=13765 RepID=A0AAV1GP12_XYRNO|nr:uncharacterized protein si:ch211-67f13.7 [Xyrichtys novacula]
MKTKLHLCILWSVLSLGLLSCAADISKSTKDKTRVFRLGSPKLKPTKVLTTSGRKSSYRSPLLSQSNSLKADPTLAPATPISLRSREPKAKTRSDFAYLPDVSVTCSTSDFVTRVKPVFYGLGAAAEELRLGSSCRSNGVLRPTGDLLFAYPLTKCDAVRQVRSPHVKLSLDSMHRIESTVFDPPESYSRATWSTNSSSTMNLHQNVSQAELTRSMSTLNVVIKGTIMCTS